MERLNAASSENKPAAVLFLDLDRFKNVNDMMGHEAGDRMLQQGAGILIEAVGDHGFVARYAGDEFVLLFPYRRQEEIESLAERLVRSFRAPFGIEGRQIYATASIGISLYPEDAHDAETLIRYADKAMYDVKHGEKNGYRFFSAIKSEELLRMVKPLLRKRSGRSCAAGRLPNAKQ